MPRTDESFVNELLNKHSSLLADVGVLSRPPKGSVKKEGFKNFSKLFCDSIVFWGLCNGLDEKSKGLTIGKYIAELREQFNSASLAVESVKLVTSGILSRSCYDYFSKKDRERYRGKSSDIYCNGYVAVKVSLIDCRARKVVSTLSSLLSTLRKRSIVLHDIDFTYDCQYITMRSFVERHLEDNGIDTVINDRKRVGDHCISWMGHVDETKNIRYKVYNKFVQVLESAEVRKSLGSRMEDLVAKEGAFARRMERHKEHGYSRVELTFYGPQLLDLSTYRKRMDDARELLGKCPTFECSFELQWKERARRIQSMLAIYFPKEKFFAYCHWWNSTTSKKYGYMWRKVPSAIAMTLLANYSFNDRPIYYLEAEVKGDTVAVTKAKVYERVPGCTAMTMVAGGQKGMFPSRESQANGARKFSKVGIVEVDNVAIGWPKKRIDRRSPPLADIVEKEVDVGDGHIVRLESMSSSSYTAGYNCLEEGSSYTIVAAGQKEYRGEWQWHFITECGKRVRAGKSLKKIWKEWQLQFADRSGCLEKLSDVEWMSFTAIRKVRSKGIGDIKCELA
ncbi:hypothetical protein BGZ75_000613 [Mortierella antarctica]|nr:hypothetical protein BGZ75_000613 [Mortierella antarctica]